LRSGDDIFVGHIINFQIVSNAMGVRSSARSARATLGFCPASNAEY
jgi:hypothetical protein